MKTNRYLPGFRVWLFAIGALTTCALQSKAAVALTVNPAVITNDYRGKLVLTITGVTPGATVNVARFADLNGNGAVDASEPLLNYFSVTDGQLPSIGGVRNLNVPGDEDGEVNSQMRVELFVPGVESIFITAAFKSVFRVSDSTSSAAQSFNVVQKVYPQGVSGRLTAAATGQVLSNTPLALIPPDGPGGILSITDSNGYYTLYGVPGVYVVVPVRPGFVADQTLGFAFACNQFVTNPITMASAALYISGRISDSSSGTGLGGIFIEADSTNNLFAAAFTDTNGNYALQVPANSEWKIKAQKEELVQLGYVPLSDKTNVPVASTSVSNVNFTLSKATAMIYGTLKDDHHNPLNFDVFAGDQGLNLYESPGRGFATNGSYCLGVRAGDWFVGLADDTLAQFGYVGDSTNVTLIDGQAVALNLTATRTNLPVLSAPLRLSSTQFQFLLTSLAGQNYTIQTITNLNASNWSSLLDTNAPCDTLLIADPQATNSSRYYRVVARP